MRHEQGLVDAAALPTVEALLAPFKGPGKFQWPYVDVRGGADATAANALGLVRAGRLSLILRFEALPVDLWPAALLRLVPEAISQAQDREEGTTVHVYVSAGAGDASVVAALPDEDDTGVLVVQLAGEKAWRLEGETATEGLIFLYTTEVQTIMKPSDMIWIPPKKEQVSRALQGTSAHLTIQAGPALAARMMQEAPAPPRRTPGRDRRPEDRPVVEEAAPYRAQRPFDDDDVLPRGVRDRARMSWIWLLLFLGAAVAFYVAAPECLKQLQESDCLKRLQDTAHSISAPPRLGRGHHRRGSSLEMEKMLDGAGVGPGRPAPPAPARVSLSPRWQGVRRRKSSKTLPSTRK